MAAKEKRASLPFYSPSTWHGMTTGVWLPLLWRNQFSISPSRMPLAAAVTFFSGFNSICRVASEALYSKKAEATVLTEPPLFVLGHWRTGTTMLHELLTQDERFSYPTTYQCMAPHHFLLTDRIFTPVVNALMPGKRPMDNMKVGARLPQEDEFALMNLGVGSNYLDWAFPNRDVNYDQFLTLQNLTPQQIENWKSNFMWFVKRLACYDTRRLVLKSPTHTARVKTILEVLPEARFIHIVRNPLDVIPSTLRTWTRMTDTLSLQVRKEDYTVDKIIDVFLAMYDQFEAERDLIPQANFYEIRYEDLILDPVAQIEPIYEKLELGDYSPAKEAITEYWEAKKDYQKNRHEQPVEMVEKIKQRCANYIEKYGYRDSFA